MKCPNCGHNEAPGAAACSKCSVMFGDLETRKRDPAPEPLPPPRTRPRPTPDFYIPPPRPSYFLAVKRFAIVAGALGLLFFGRSLIGFIDGLLKADMFPDRTTGKMTRTYRPYDPDRRTPVGGIAVTRQPAGMRPVMDNSRLLMQEQLRMNAQLQAVQEQARIQAQIQAATDLSRRNAINRQYQPPPPSPTR